MGPRVGPTAPRVCQVPQLALVLDIAVKQVRQRVPVASRNIKRDQDVDRVVCPVGNDNKRRSDAQGPDKEHAEPGEPAVPAWKAVVAVAGPDQGRDDKDDGVSTEHAVAAAMQLEGGEEFADGVLASDARVWEGGNGYGGDAHQVAEGPGEEDLAEEVEWAIVGEDKEDCWCKQEDVGQVREPEEGDGGDGIKEAVGELWGCCVVWRQV